MKKKLTSADLILYELNDLIINKNLSNRIYEFYYFYLNPRINNNEFPMSSIINKKK